MVAAAVVGTGVLGAVVANKAGSRQADAANNAADKQQEQYWQTREDQTPYRESGYKALDQINAGMGPGGYFTHQFDTNDLKNGLAPNYDFMLGQGQQANQNAAGVGGGLVGGNALAGLQRYTQDYAGNAYQQAFNNYTGQQANIFNRLSSIAGLGQTANQATSNVGVQTANNAGNYMTQGANAQAAGLVGASNAASNGLGNYLGWNYLNGGGGGYNPSAGTSWSGNSVTSGGNTYFEGGP